TLLISFKKFYFDFVQRQTKIGEVTLDVLEEIVSRLTVANKVMIRGSSSIISGPRIDIRIDNTNPSIFDDDTTHTYWRDAADKTIKYKYKTNGFPESPEKVIAKNIEFFRVQFPQNVFLSRGGFNQVEVKIGLKPEGGVQQYFETTVVIRCRSAQEL
ncbi:MAG: hypothetical protein NC828_04210, partial [Candidatus Omnitrophica bacterium]|nr:hypothetical protein [Candidatus Omnitrophota bacterium]